jgi:23S rRNA pseudouridine2604 synthase
MSEPIRLAKRVAALAACSRRDAELYIQGGCVSVDGVVARQPQLLVSNEVVHIEAKAKPVPLERVTLIANQSPDSPLDLQAASRSALDSTNRTLDQSHFAGLLAILPLPADVSGLSIFSQDRSFSAHMAENGRSIEQEYIVEVQGDIVPYGLALLRQGVPCNGRAIAPMQVSWQNEIRLRFALKDVQHGQFQAMCAQVGLSVIAIKRIRVGRIPLAKIAPGEWRYLDARERF